MEVLDYGKSFVTFVTHGRANNARLQVESRCRLTDARSGSTRDYLFFASCKSEHTFVERGLFCQENYDFCGVFSDAEYAIFRTRATHSERYREVGLWAERFHDVVQHLPLVQAAELAGPDTIVRASLANMPLVGQVELQAPGQRLQAMLEFPIKTMNANDIRNVYQVDTGPVAFPDFAVDTARHIERLWPAYVAYNTNSFADFVVQHPHPVPGHDGAPAATVTHFGRLESLPAVTRVLEVPR